MHGDQALLIWPVSAAGRMADVTDAGQERERRLRRAFGEVLPDTTADERDAGPVRRDPDHDDWLRENRPPHHDRED